MFNILILIDTIDVHYIYMTVPKQNGLKAANRGGRGTQTSTFLIGKLSPKRNVLVDTRTKSC